MYNNGNSHRWGVPYGDNGALRVFSIWGRGNAINWAFEDILRTAQVSVTWSFTGSVKSMNLLQSYRNCRLKNRKLEPFAMLGSISGAKGLLDKFSPTS